MRRFIGLLAGILLVVLATTPALADSTTWKLYSFNSSGQALRAQVAAVAADGTVSFTFPSTPDAAYLTTAKSGTGDMTDQTLAATVSVAASGGTTFENYNDHCGVQIPTVGLYFQTSSTGGFNPSAYWWSTNRVSVTSLVGLSTGLSTRLVAGFWTNYYGQTDPAGFAAAVVNVTSWGVSFGGGCHYASGVGTPTGSATFSLVP